MLSQFSILEGETLEKEYDLALLAENLAEEIPEITELYLFGSRARGTKSTRSDADVLVITDEYIKPQQLRKFSFENCEALDLFTVDGGKATSTQNESFIEAENFSSLIALLGALRIWSRSEGRAQANIEWRFKVQEDVEFIPTSLPNTVIQESQKLPPFDPSELTLKEIISNLTIPQIWKAFAAIVALLGIVAAAGYWLGSN